MFGRSAHHAAVNFGQYDYSGYMPNKATFVSHRIPDAGSPEEQVSCPGIHCLCFAVGTLLDATYFKISAADEGVMNLHETLVFCSILQALLNDYEYEFLRILSDPVRTLQTLLLTKVLSNHSLDEEFIANDATEWLMVRTHLICLSAHDQLQKPQHADSRLPVFCLMLRAVILKMSIWTVYLI
jgi:hypothetical protein